MKESDEGTPATKAYNTNSKKEKEAETIKTKKNHSPCGGIKVQQSPWGLPQIHSSKGNSDSQVKSKATSGAIPFLARMAASPCNGHCLTETARLV